MEFIVKSIFGSHLYGTSTPDSDTDYKGIYLPTKNECYLNNISKSINTSTGEDNSKNTKDDVDEEIFSLQYFMKLAISGEMIVLDLIHTPDNLIIEKNHIWDTLRQNRSIFYTKKLSGYLGYIRKQTAKYGVKGSRLKAMEEMVNVLKKEKPSDRLSSIWDKLPINEFSSFVENPKEKRFKMYECCGRQFPETITIDYALGIVSNLYSSYGARAQMAKDNEGIDWKAVSHAFRAGLQLKEIYETGDLQYPLKDCEYIKDIKLGKYHYLNDNISVKLEDILLDVETLAINSNYPDTVNTKMLDNLVLNCYN